MPPGMPEGSGVQPLLTFPVTSNATPYTRCLQDLATIQVGDNLPVIAVGEVADKTGMYRPEGLSRELSQGASEMLISALYKTGKVRLTERWDLRIPLAEMRLVEQNMIRTLRPEDYNIRPSDFVVLGALTELNYNIFSGGAGAFVAGFGAGARGVVVNVALDLRVIQSRTLDVPYAVSLQKQIVGTEVEANVFRFFGNQLVGLDLGGIHNEPLQLGVRSVVEMAVYQIMTDYLGLPQSERCRLAETQFFDEYL
jgi:curli biogenesis system outer membrane secretion channel CsgG